MSINYIDPYVKVLSSIDKSQAYDLWIKSREKVVSYCKPGYIKVGTEEVELNEYTSRIFKMGLQYTNFPTWTLEIQGSTIFRDILFTLNKCPQWATSLRFINSTYDTFDQSNYKVSSEYKGIDEWESQFYRYMDKIQETMVTDENRVEMPYSMSSRYWIQINYKTLIGFLSMLKLKMPFFYDIYGTKIMQVTGITESDLVPYIDASIAQYFTHVNTEFKESFIRIDDTVILNKTIGLLLFSQFIRQQDSCIKGLYDMLVHTDPDKFKHKMFYASTPINVRYVADYSRFIRTISNRLCWFSMSSGHGFNSWSSILDLVLKDMDINEFRELIPCKIVNGHITCKYKDDVKFRAEGIEKRNLPCGLLYMNRAYCIERNDYDKTNLSKKYLELYDIFNKEGVQK